MCPGRVKTNHECEKHGFRSTAFRRGVRTSLVQHTHSSSSRSRRNTRTTASCSSRKARERVFRVITLRPRNIKVCKEWPIVVVSPPDVVQRDYRITHVPPVFKIQYDITVTGPGVTGNPEARYYCCALFSLPSPILLLKTAVDQHTVHSYCTHNFYIQVPYYTFRKRIATAKPRADLNKTIVSLRKYNSTPYARLYKESQINRLPFSEFTGRNNNIKCTVFSVNTPKANVYIYIYIYYTISLVVITT